MTDCDHRFVYAGVRHAHGVNNLPGGGATRRYYAHVYFCPSCLAEVGKPIPSIEENSYGRVGYGSTPGDPAVVGVPETDREGWRWKHR